MRIIRILLALLLAIAVNPVATRPADAAGATLTLGEPKPLPAFAFETLDGTKADTGIFDGRITVLNLWATWCAPCREEMPALDRLQAAFDPAELTVVALSVDRAGPERVAKFLDEIGTKRLSVYRDGSGATSRALRLPGLPATLILDRDGREIGRVLGIAAWDGPEIIRTLRELVAKPG